MEMNFKKLIKSNWKRIYNNGNGASKTYTTHINEAPHEAVMATFICRKKVNVMCRMMLQQSLIERRWFEIRIDWAACCVLERVGVLTTNLSLLKRPAIISIIILLLSLFMIIDHHHQRLMTGVMVSYCTVTELDSSPFQNFDSNFQLIEFTLNDGLENPHRYLSFVHMDKYWVYPFRYLPLREIILFTSRQCHLLKSTWRRSKKICLPFSTLASTNSKFSHRQKPLRWFV